MAKSATLLLIVLAGLAGGVGAAPARANEAAIAPQPAVPSAETLLMLVRSTISALNQANFTGNYTVIRDLGSPALHLTTAADLSLAFTDLRRRKIDLSPGLILTPQLTAGPTVDANGVLSLAGHFATKPLRITFAMTFQPVNGIWRLHGLSVDTVPAP